MLEALKQKSNLTYTENGAVTFRSTGSDCLDFFSSAGALRQAPMEEILTRFRRAWGEDRDLAMKLLFYARDVRGGLGERRLFRGILPFLAQTYPESLRRNLPYIPEYGRWDDLLPLLGTPCQPEAVALIARQLQQDREALAQGGQVSLLGKWLPSANTSSRETVAQARRLSRALGLGEAEYRKTLSALRRQLRLLENYLREGDYSFDYGKQPSRALFQYRKAFLRNDSARYQEFLERVRWGEAKLHTGSLTPYDILAPFFSRSAPLSPEERGAIQTAWEAQEDFTRGENALVVVDGSGSMYWGEAPKPAAVALSLALYFAQRCRGAFRNHFITFSHRPQLVEIKGRDLGEQLDYCQSFNEVADTNLQRVFEMLLLTALERQVPQVELPSTLYIITDMEFNSCVTNAELTNFQYAKDLFSRHGYQLPRVVFWNVNSRNRQQPVTQNEQGVILVSGCTSRTFSLLTSGCLSPYAFMLEVLSSERYQQIAA